MTDSYTAEAVDPAAEPEHLANLRLTYVQGSAAYYLPCGNTRLMRAPLPWATAMMSTRRCTPFSAYYVPAVELDGIDVLKNK